MLDQIQGNDLACELDRLGVHFVRTDVSAISNRQLKPAELLAGLASSPEARLRLSLIPLFLSRPEYSTAAQAVVESLASRSRIMLQCYYTAAFLLQQKYAHELKRLRVSQVPLPDLFSDALNLTLIGTIDAQLDILARQQAALSSEAINWLGTYLHAANSYIFHLEREAVWGT